MKDRKVKILIVDDEKDARKLMSDILEDQNYVICTEGSVREAREYLSVYIVDIVITDIKMPGEDGLSLLKFIKEKYSEMPVILSTGHGDKQLAIEAIRLGAFDFIEKPFREEELLSSILKAVNYLKLKQDLKEAQDISIQSAKLASIGELAAGIAHEINNPLTIISGQLLRFQNFMNIHQIKDDKLIKALKVAENAIERIAIIVKGLGGYARKDSDVNYLIDVNKVIDEMIALVRGIYSHSGVKIETDFQSEKTIIFGSIGKLQQVIVNLMSNAKDAVTGKNGGKILIRTSNVGNVLKVDIIDNGVGIKEENMDKIFDSFFSTKDVGKGTGLGLSITYRIIQEFKGSIKVQSKEGEGSVFTIELPIIVDPHRIDVSKDLDYDGRIRLSGRILLVEDEREIRNMLKDYLEDLGFVVDEAENGLMALEKLKRKEYNLMITDILMPEMSGDLLINEIRKLGLNDLKILVISASLKYVRDNIQNVQFVDGVLTKPILARDILEALLKLPIDIRLNKTQKVS